MPAVSIIIPIYNVEKYLDKCLSSCINQTFGDIEIICINDGSSDNSQLLIDKYALIDSRVRSISKVNEGVVIARNEGVCRAKGSYIFFLDADDYLSENAIEILYGEIVKYDADFVRGEYDEVDEDGYILERNNTTLRFLNRKDFVDYLSSGLGAMWNYLIRKDKYVNIHVDPNTRIGEDLLTLLYLSFNIERGVFVNHKTYFYRQRSGSVMRPEGGYEQVETKFRYYVDLCTALDRFGDENCNRLPKDEQILLSKLICDEITVNLFPESFLVKQNISSIAPLYKKHFLYNWKVQKIVFRRSWKCWVSMFMYWIKIGGIFL